MTADAYKLLHQALVLWQQNAMANNNASDLKKNAFAIPLSIKCPDGVWQATDVSYDPIFGIVVEAKIKPYTSNE